MSVKELLWDYETPMQRRTVLGILGVILVEYVSGGLVSEGLEVGARYAQNQFYDATKRRDDILSLFLPTSGFDLSVATEGVPDGAITYSNEE